jgi:hypothetical protein
MPDTIVLSKTDSMKIVKLKLSCGCGFIYSVTGVAASPPNMSSYLKYSPIEPMGDTLHEHSITFYFEPSAAPAGAYPYSVYFYAQKQVYSYQNSLHVRIEN